MIGEASGHDAWIQNDEYTEYGKKGGKVLCRRVASEAQK